jgi:hypothetical protein
MFFWFSVIVFALYRQFGSQKLIGASRIVGYIL